MGACQKYVVCFSFVWYYIGIEWQHISIFNILIYFSHVPHPTPFSNKTSILQRHRNPFQHNKVNTWENDHLRPPSKAENKRIMASPANSQAHWWMWEAFKSMCGTVFCLMASFGVREMQKMWMMKDEQTWSLVIFWLSLLMGWLD